jgi:hypothetical protein
MEFVMKKLLVAIALLLGPVLSAGPGTAAPPEKPNPNKPVVIDIINGSGTIPAIADGGACAFPVDVVVTGKFKIIESQQGRTIFTSPGQKVTLTNGTKSVSYVVTGVRREVATQTPDGTVLEEVVTGRNVVTNARDANSERVGLFLLVGEFNYAITDDLPVPQEVRVFSGKGQVVDVCAALA